MYAKMLIRRDGFDKMSEFIFLNTEDLSDGEIYLHLRARLPNDEEKDYVPTYIFAITKADTNEAVGELALRIGYSRGLYYAGHIGYHVDMPYRGHNYAEKACRIAFHQAKKHNMEELAITCNPDNIPSRRTCEKLGGYLKEIVDVPTDTELYQMGDRQKCIFLYEL